MEIPLVDLKKQYETIKSEINVSTGIHYLLHLYLQPVFEFSGYKKGDFPVAEKLAFEVLSLPMFPELTEKEIEYIVKKIEDFYSKK